MPKEFSRARRVAEQIQRELADLLRREVNDSRLQQVTLSGVEVSRDLGHAKVYVTPHMGADVEATVSALNRASSFLRRNLASRLLVRSVPQLKFVYDPTLDNATRLSALLAGDATTERET